MQWGQVVQYLLTALRGRNRWSSQPGMPSRPRMQSLVRHDTQTTGSRTLTSSGEASDWTKLNWPIGQTYLQKDAPRKKPSTMGAAAREARTLKGVRHGLSQRANPS